MLDIIQQKIIRRAKISTKIRLRAHTHTVTHTHCLVNPIIKCTWYSHFWKVFIIIIIVYHHVALSKIAIDLTLSLVHPVTHIHIHTHTYVIIL